MDSFTEQVKRTLRRIPRGCVATYGQVAVLSGNPRAARQVVRVLHSSAEKDKLPWHRVINSSGRISLPIGSGCELQQALLKREGVRFKLDGSIDLERFQWQPRSPVRKTVRRREPGGRHED
jgi:methylated-DNA-protein-cysteine methyltransferase related protein